MANKLTHQQIARAKNAQPDVDGIVDGIMHDVESRLKALDTELKAVAEESRDRILRLIRSREFRQRAPNAEAYAAQKIAMGKGDQPLIFDGDYINAIIVVKDRDCGYRVTVSDGIHPGSGLPFEKLRRIHEYGTTDGHIPPRPHFRPIMAWASNKAKELIERRNATLRKAQREAKKTP